ncbi:hypothetical protein VTO42DRAFT_1848 [Malbranchea cinnamomea]
MDKMQGRQRQNLRPGHRRALSSSIAASAFASDAASGPPTTQPFEAKLKVAIPRIHRPGSKSISVALDRPRVRHACEPCRHKKSKCDGNQPVCSRCRSNGIHCFYADNKRDKLKRQVSLLIDLHRVAEHALSFGLAWI